VYPLATIMMRQTSLLAWEVRVRPELSLREREVFDVIVRLGCEATMFDVQPFIGRPLNCFSGRFKALERKERIYDTGKRKLNAAGNSCVVWGVVC